MYVILDADQQTVQDTDQGELVRVLQQQLAAEREASREMQRLLAATLRRVPPAIEPPGPQDQAESAEPRPDEGTASEAAEGPERATERWGWWRRWFGGELAVLH